MGGTAIKNVVWFKDHKDDNDQDYLGGPWPPPGHTTGCTSRVHVQNNCCELVDHSSCNY